jgi:predicted nucleic acid-binding Zn ribbon protein
MPRYVYEIISESGEPGERFEVVQPMTDPPLTTHPTTGQPVRRVITAPWIAGKFSPMTSERSVNNDKKLERLGFTKYVKSGDGTYEKTVGKGPDLIRK